MIKGVFGQVEFEKKYFWFVNGGDCQIDLERLLIEWLCVGVVFVIVGEFGYYYCWFVDKEL